MSEFKVGDIVVPSSEILSIAPYWKGAKFKIISIKQLDGVFLELIESPLAPFIHKKEIFWLIKWIKLDTSVPNTSVSNECSCELQIIMIKGCQCGGE